MNIIKLIAANWDGILLVVAFVVGLVSLYKKGEIKVLKEILFRLVTEAEKEYGGGTGVLKKAAVIEWVYDKMPAIVRAIITKKQLESLIDDVLKNAKLKWAANPKLREYILGEPLAGAENE